MEVIEIEFKGAKRKTDVIRCPYCNDSSLDGWNKMQCGWKFELILPEGGGNGEVINKGGCNRQPDWF